VKRYGTLVDKKVTRLFNIQGVTKGEHT